MPNLIQVLYKVCLQPILFFLDAETAHTWALSRLKGIQRNPIMLGLMHRSLIVDDHRLHVKMPGFTCPNPVGLAAGFDKEADLLNFLPFLGFGFAEVGTFTPLPQPGQDKPRLFRFKSQKALLNRMGFNNPGVEMMEEKFAMRGCKLKIPIGINIGKGKMTPPEKAIEDYKMVFERAQPRADYVVVNVSSPNTPGLRDLQSVTFLKELLSTLKELNQKNPKQLFVKVAPDLADETLADIGTLCLKEKVGLIATNTTIDQSSLGEHDKGGGGVSGRPLKERANDVLKNLRSITKGKVPLIGVGGIFSAEDAYEKIRLGASLVQVYTGWIYRGPGLVPKINRGLLDLLERDGFDNVEEAIGTK